MTNAKAERPRLIKTSDQEEVQPVPITPDPPHGQLVIKISGSTMRVLYRFVIIILGFSVLVVLLTLGRNALNQLQNRNENFDPISTTLSAQVGGVPLDRDEGVSEVASAKDPDNIPEPTGQIGEGIQTEREPESLEPEVTTSAQASLLGHSEQGFSKVLLNQQAIETSGLWSATDYVPGDIIAQSYVVQRGDTLWEIAEGYYGNGLNWTKILEANNSSIGFLPDGSQALIIPGQVLTLP